MQNEGYTVFWAKTIREAKLFNEKENIDLMLLDIGLPDGNGLEFCKSLRVNGSRTPILILTASLEEESAVKSFEYGADDYVRKPFGMNELLARVKRNLNLPKGVDEKIRFQDLTIVLKKREAYCGNTLLDLNRREFDILLLFVENAERVLSRSEILDKLSVDTEVNDRAIDSHISHLRSVLKKLPNLKHQISSIYGVGYKLEKK